MSKLIIIEGVDCSGKATQTELLINRLQENNQPAETYPFPRHGQQFFGLLVDKYLNNEFGDAARLDPHIASLFFACDRWEVKDMLDQWLRQGKTVVLDRYATSNMAHQAGKIKDPQARDEFLNWLHQMEFEVFKIPKPDLALYLDVPIDIVWNLMDTRSRAGKEYINGRKDGHEGNIEHLRDTRQVYLDLCKKYDYWERIECVRNNQLLTKQKIHDKIWKIVGNQ